jgi:hypothetical protein
MEKTVYLLYVRTNPSCSNNYPIVCRAYDNLEKAKTALLNIANSANQNFVKWKNNDKTILDIEHDVFGSIYQSYWIKKCNVE